MKKVIKYASLFVAASALIMSCGKKDDVTPTNTPTCDGGSVKTDSIKIDYSTKASVYVKNYDYTVTKCDGTSNILLDIKAQDDMDKIFITLSQDNGPSSQLIVGSDISGSVGASDVASSSKTFKKGSTDNYSLDVPDLDAGIASTKYIRVSIPVPVRSSDAAVTDVYTIWITNGTGSFSTPGKKTIVGPVTLTLHYGSIGTKTYVQATGIQLGDQTATPPSYLATQGQISAVSGGSLYADADGYTDAEKTTAMNGMDIDFVSISSDGNAAGTTCGNAVGAKPYFIGVGLRSTLGPCLSNTAGTNQTLFASYTFTGDVATAFNSITATTLSSPPSISNDRIQVVEGGLYWFKTADGRVGVIKSTGLTVASSGRLNATVNVDLKVLTK